MTDYCLSAAVFSNYIFTSCLKLTVPVGSWKTVLSEENETGEDLIRKNQVTDIYCREAEN